MENMMAKFHSNERNINSSEKLKLLGPLLRLRQACCHPQIGSKGIKALHKNTMSMDELLDQVTLDCYPYSSILSYPIICGF